MNSIQLFGFKRKLGVFSAVEGFFELHSSATEQKKRQKQDSKQWFFSEAKKFK